MSQGKGGATVCYDRIQVLEDNTSGIPFDCPSIPIALVWRQCHLLEKISVPRTSYKQVCFSRIDT